MQNFRCNASIQPQTFMEIFKSALVNLSYSFLKETTSFLDKDFLIKFQLTDEPLSICLFLKKCISTNIKTQVCTTNKEVSVSCNLLMSRN